MVLIVVTVVLVVDDEFLVIHCCYCIPKFSRYLLPTSPCCFPLLPLVFPLTPLPTSLPTLLPRSPGQVLCGHCREETHRARMFSLHDIIHMSKRGKEVNRKVGCASPVSWYSSLSSSISFCIVLSSCFHVSVNTYWCFSLLCLSFHLCLLFGLWSFPVSLS